MELKAMASVKGGKSVVAFTELRPFGTVAFNTLFLLWDIIDGTLDGIFGSYPILFENSPCLRDLVIYEMRGFQLKHSYDNSPLRSLPLFLGGQKELLTRFSYNNSFKMKHFPRIFR